MVDLLWGLLPVRRPGGVGGITRVPDHTTKCLPEPLTIPEADRFSQVFPQKDCNASQAGCNLRSFLQDTSLTIWGTLRVGRVEVVDLLEGSTSQVHVVEYGPESRSAHLHLCPSL